MKKIITAALMVLLVSSCYKPGQYPLPLRLQALDYMESYRNYFLQGRLCDSAIAFDQAVSLFKRIDDLCAVSDAYLQNYLFHAYAGNVREDLLDKAREFASLENCQAQRDRIEEIKGNSGSALNSSSGNAPNDIYRSVTLRKLAGMEKNQSYAEEALQLDRSHGWTLFMSLDLAAMEELSNSPEEKERLQKRVEILNSQIQTCE
jgi:tetratricopeptide (TPR) repeat protein